VNKTLSEPKIRADVPSVNVLIIMKVI